MSEIYIVKNNNGDIDGIYNSFVIASNSINYRYNWSLTEYTLENGEYEEYRTYRMCSTGLYAI